MREPKEFTNDHPNRKKVIIALLRLSGRIIPDDYELEPKEIRMYKSYKYRLLIRPLVLEDARRKNMKDERNLAAFMQKYQTTTKTISNILNNYHVINDNMIS